ncbi:MAG: hypothetical protein LKH74_00735 [Levilactobacillus sp.]|jgi:hypothetical protein|uniref:hypothetical protein n=1 Tax=Levilactobacillus sp. TaxID=2767919 RepID=UPI00258C6047|nr:hypothetical protein [Levilactobacillus sp.]MCH4123427.1 hypothetical protein [Levilactobacillus sp.]MCI1552435.1 hypothetical protein [Levilactobacillus sp.]MCI1599022.1 hypothetical protein [Levilactobacillus sp.]MCI1606062.1 hypothetical protein [Levilactobacillus sp.]
MTLTPSELRSLLKQDAAFRNARAILTDEWAARAAENPLFQAPMTIADLKFALDLQAAGVADSAVDFTDYAAVQAWIGAHRQSLTPNDIAWLQRNFE